MNNREKIELILRFTFRADHALIGYDEQHPHLWHVVGGIEGDPINGRIVDMPLIEGAFHSVIAPLTSTYLNDNPHLQGTSAWNNPTCETLSEYFVHRWSDMLEPFRKDNPTIRLSFVEMVICDPDGVEMGAVRRTLLADRAASPLS